MTCPCDLPAFPRGLAIPPGLTRLARQVAAFPELRQAMLSSIGSDAHAAALANWRADGPNDLGVMLVEMWAYLGDIVAFYDEVHAHECYLRTARLPESVRGLVERLGYRPRPAVAAVVELALLADGRKPLRIPVGAAFRSAAFGEEPPQVFESEAEATIHPLLSRWAVAPPRPIAVDDPGGPGAMASTLRLEPARSAKWAAGDRVLVQPLPATSSTWAVRTINGTEPVTTDDGAKWTDLELSAAVSLGTGTPLAGVRLLRPTKQAGLWIQTDVTAVSESFSDYTTPTVLTLDGLYRDLRPGAPVLVSCTAPGREGLRWFQVVEVTETTVPVPMATDADGNPITGNLPATQVKLDVDIDNTSRGSVHDWDDEDAAHLLVHYDLRNAGRLAAPAQSMLPPDAPLALSPPAARPLPDPAAARFVLQDADGQAVGFGGSVDFDDRLVTATSYDTPRLAMTLPAHVFGNLVAASRGETVAREVLGSGDANAASQSFELAKSPLTYVPSATAAEGFASTLQVWVDGVLWREKPGFYGAGPDDPCYVVRVDGDGVATVTFGDGVRGARLPTGIGNVVAAYRNGAGAAAPPAGSIAQIARGVAGLRAVKQPFAAYGGSDAEGPETMREGAPRQTLTLGRAVSIRDMEAFAAACNGVRAVAVTWAWDARGLRPSVKVWVAGEGDVAATVRARLLAVCDPTTPIAVAAASAVPIALALDVETDPARVGDEVLGAVAAALLDAPGGLLAVEQVGIGRPFYFSRLSEVVHGVAGVVSMQSTWTREGVVAAGYGDTPGEGAYFDFGGGVALNGEVLTSGS